MAQSVDATCAEIIKQPGMASGCNTFVQAVVAKVIEQAVVAKVIGKDAAAAGNAAVAGDADAIRASLSKSPFKQIGKNPQQATSYATQGKLVIGALSRTEMTFKDKGGHQHLATMGHVVVVAPEGRQRQLQLHLKMGRPNLVAVVILIATRVLSIQHIDLLSEHKLTLCFLRVY